jgi:hypothetical protein
MSVYLSSVGSSECSHRGATPPFSAEKAICRMIRSPTFFYVKFLFDRVSVAVS